ncbi:MAG: glycosyltransferase family 4 protein [Chloroflexi bacterium]|nr:MAG: glycosyltransferase family 4 protein [Chloroflexota bacterium]
MHVFIVPSWYPTKDEPIKGCFLQEEAHALGCIGKDTRISVSLHGTGTYLLDPRSPILSMRRLRGFWDARTRNVEVLAHNIIEIDRPILEWSPWLVGGNTQGMVKSHQANFIEAEQIHGKVDIIHAHVGYPAGWIAWQLSRKFRRPFVITEHMGPFPWRVFRKADGSLVDRLSAPFAASAGNVAVSPALANEMTRHGIPRITIIPNLVDEERFSPVPRVHAEEDFVFFSLCHLVAQKGLEELLRATARAMAEIPSIRLVIGGDGLLREALKILAHDLRISQRVTWLGSVNPSSAPGHYQNCDAFILASRAETFGVVCTEALACGKPVIATRCGGPESILHERNGILVRNGDVDALAAAMVKMARNPERFPAEQIRHDFLERFSRSAVVQQLLALYRSVIAEPQTDRCSVKHNRSVAQVVTY